MVEEGLNADRAIPMRRWPGLRMVAAVRMAFDGQKLIIAAAGVLLLQLGWALLDLAFADSADVTPDIASHSAVARPPDDFTWSTESAIERLSEPARVLITPLFALLDPRNRWAAMLHASLGLTWLVVLWGFCGGAIARLAAIQEARSSRPGIAEAIRFARKSVSSLILAPLFPLVALAFVALTGLVFGLLYRISGGSAVAGVVLFIPLLAGLVMTLLVAALVAGWPLFHAAMATGADNALDALSRTYSYLNQRLILFAVGIAIAFVTGLVGLTLMDWLAGGVVRLTRWNLSLIGPPSRVDLLFGRVADVPDPSPVVGATHRFWLGVVRLFVHAWVYSYFWSAATLLYLWLRQEVDGTPSSLIEPAGASIKAD